MLNYPVSTGQDIQKQNQGNELPPAASLVVNDSTSTSAMLDHQTSPSSSSTVDPVPTTIPSTTENDPTVGPAVESISCTEESIVNPVFSGKPADNGHPESSHFLNSNNSNQVVLGQE